MSIALAEGALAVQRLHVGVELGRSRSSGGPTVPESALAGQHGKGGSSGSGRLRPLPARHHRPAAWAGIRRGDGRRLQITAVMKPSQTPLRNFAARAQVVQQVVELFQSGSRQAQRRAAAEEVAFSSASPLAQWIRWDSWVGLIGRRARVAGFCGAPAVVAQRRGRVYPGSTPIATPTAATAAQ